MNPGHIIAICALALTLYGLYATRRHNRLSLTPHLCGCRNKLTTNDGLTFTYTVSNNGIGPARITSFVLWRDSKPFARGVGEYIEDFIRELVGDKLKYEIKSSSTLGDKTSMRPGDSTRIIEIYFPGAKRGDEAKIQEFIGAAAVRIEYESIYRKRFVFDSRD
jgi:hypothetical protein